MYGSKLVSKEGRKEGGKEGRKEGRQETPKPIESVSRHINPSYRITHYFRDNCFSRQHVILSHTSLEILNYPGA
jgi:predicted transposase YdaD